MMKAKWNNEIIAESDNTVIVEGNHYFPENTIIKEYFRNSDHHTYCSWKGNASYYHLEVNGKTNENAAWYYPDAKKAAKNIEGRIAFWKGVEVID